MPFSIKEYLIDSKGNNVEEEFPSFVALSSFKESTKLKKIIGSQKFIDIFTKNLDSLQKPTGEWRDNLIKKAVKKLEEQHKKELSHLRYLVKVNPMYTEHDVEGSRDKFNKVKELIEKSYLNLDAIRVVFVNP